MTTTIWLLQYINKKEEAVNLDAVHSFVSLTIYVNFVILYINILIFLLLLCLLLIYLNY